MMLFPPTLWMLLADAAAAAQPVHQVAKASGMTEEVKVALTVGASILLALIGVVFYLGRKIGSFGERVQSFEKEQKFATDAGERWNRDMIEALRELDARLTDQNQRLSDLEYKWRDAHNVAERVRDLEDWRREVDVRCEERARSLEGSKRIIVQSEDGAPIDRLFEASKREKEEK